MATSSTVTLPGKLENLHALVDFVTSYAVEQGFGGKKISEIELALEEIIVNIIKHAYKAYGIDGDIEINCWLDKEKRLNIEITDSGTPFDIFSAREPDIDADIDERQIGGLGIFFVKKLMDEVRYKRENDQNKLTLVIYNSTVPEN